MPPAEAVLEEESVDTEVLENEVESTQTEAGSAPETQATETPTTPTVDERLAALSAAGVRVQSDNFESALGEIAQQQQYLLQQHRELEQLRYQAQQFQQLQPEIQAWQQWRAQQAQVQPPPPQPAWNPPALSDVARRYMAPDGQPVEDAPVAARNEIEAYNAYRANFVEKLTHNPGEALAPIVRELTAPLFQQFDQAVNQRVQQIQSEQFNRAYLTENADWAFEKDANGRPQFNPLTGQGVPSAYGRRYGEILSELAATIPGIPDRVAIQLGEKMLGLEIQAYANQQQAAQATQQNNAVDVRNQFLKNAATRQPNRSGSIPKQNDAPAQNGLLSLRQQLLQDFKEAGYSHERDGI